MAVQETDFLVKLGDPAFDDLVENLLRLPSSTARARAISFSLLSTSAGSPLCDVADRRRNVHGDIVHQFFKIVGARHEIGFAVHSTITPSWPRGGCSSL